MFVTLFIVCLLLFKVSLQYSGSILQMEDVTVQLGGDVTLHCFYPKDQMNRVMWYKQTLGEKPVLVASSYFWTQTSEYYDDFKESKRFIVTALIDSFNLTIQKTEESDSATYYCAGSFSNIVYFGAGANLVVRGSKSTGIQILNQTEREITSLNGDVTLQCSVRDEQQSCRDEQKVYWFKQGSGKSQPGIIYPRDSCKNSSCTYKLSMRNIKSSDAGIYFCAVVTCGEILFGRGIHLDIDDSKSQNALVYTLIGLAALLTISFFSNVILFVTMKKGKTSQQVQATTDVMPSSQLHNASDVNYAALKFTKQSSRRSREDNRQQTKYSGIN